MKRRKLALGRRFAAAAAAAVLALSLAGDRGRAASVPAAIYGQDPLEVLELKVRPNVIVVLDSSTSMTREVTETTDMVSGDHPRSKMHQAKQVLKTVVRNNQDKVSFQFGTYTQNGVTFSNQGAGANRFQYVTSTMPAPELTVRRALGDGGTTNRGLQSWQIIDPAWGTLYFDEDAAPDAVCTATLTGLPRFYASGSALATELAAAMNSPSVICTGSSRANTYAVAYNTGTGQFTFSRTVTNRPFRIRWDRTPNNIRNALAETSSTLPGFTTGSVPTDAPWTLLYRRQCVSGDPGYNAGPPATCTVSSGVGLNTRYVVQESIAGVTTTFYQVRAGRLWNGETIRVDSNGAVCGMTFTAKTSPPSLTVQLADALCNPITGSATFTYAGGDFSRSGDGCRGFRSKSALIPCDLQSPPAPTQIDQILPYIDDELPTAATGDPQDLTTNDATGAYGGANYGVPDGVPDYVERPDGSWAVQFVAVAPSAKTANTSYTPIANSLIDIKGLPDGTNSCVTTAPPPSGKFDSLTVAATVGACVERGFSKLWNQGQTGTLAMAGPAPWQLDPIKNHKDPKEKTIVLFVTDGNDTCGSRGDSNGGATDANARRAASYAEVLYTRIDAAEPASSVQTYVIGYGGIASGDPKLLNFIAWGGSGLGQNTPTQPDVNWTSDSDTTIANQRARCTTCTDAFQAPDAATLASQLQSIIDQGASDGDFNAQQSITESVFEYVDRATTATRTYGALSPSSRYQAITPTRFVSSFSLPGFNGQLKAYQNDGSGNAVLRWSAGDKLWAKVSTAMNTCNNAAAGGLAGECAFSQLHGGTTDATIAGSAAKIQRRIYTTDRNGVYTFTPQSLMAGTANSRRTLWPPEAAVAPNDYATPGLFDLELGLPLDTPTCTLVTPYTSCVDQELARLQKQYKACVGPSDASLPANCRSTAAAATRMRAARREARDIMLAFMAGAATVPDTTGIKRTTAAVGSSPAQSLFFKARSWVLADSELATAAVVTQPNLNEPTGTPYLREYELFRDGPRDTSTGKNPDTAGNQIRQGFGLTSPDDDQTVGTDVDDTRANLKPVMTVIYAPANDMLHAFRAGPCFSPSSSGSPTNCASASYPESGGEELWGFVPYDQLAAVGLRPAYEPQGRSNHVYMLARGVRFADVFVPGAMTNVGIGGVTEPSMQGVWRRVLYIGRGIGGKHVTALDVTAPGPYTAAALSTVGPIPLWNRGNPDSQNGLASGLDNGSSADRTAYARMGETWSLPTVAYVNNDKTNPIYQTTRRPDGIDFAIFMGSGYSTTPGEGTTHYTLDALSGDVIAAVDVEAVAASNGLTRTICSTDPTGKPVETATCSVMPNALVANSVSFNRSAFAGAAAKVFNVNPHPWSNVSTRVYIGDLHGRLWKFLTASPDVAIPFADLGADQPIATAVALLAEGTDPATNVPLVLVSAGADKRASGPSYFRSFSLRDNGTDTSTVTTGTVTDDGVTTFTPAEKLFARTFDQGDPEANCGYPTEAVFRGTIQPAGAVECSVALAGNGKCPGDILERVFFGGTRLSLPNTQFAPPTPLSCGTGEYPCRSQFDSVLYALGAITGQAAYALNTSGDNAYRIFRDSRIVAISMQADPDPGRGGSSFIADEGLVKGTPKAPPPPGVPPSATSATANVVIRREPGQPSPAVRYGSTVCQ